MTMHGVVVGNCLIDDAELDLGDLSPETQNTGAAAIAYACTNGTAALIVPATATIELRGRNDPSRRLDVQVASVRVTGDGRGAVATLAAVAAPAPRITAEVFEGDLEVRIQPTGAPEQGRRAMLHIRALVG